MRNSTASTMEIKSKQMVCSLINFGCEENHFKTFQVIFENCPCESVIQITSKIV